MPAYAGMTSKRSFPRKRESRSRTYNCKPLYVWQDIRQHGSVEMTGDSVLWRDLFAYWYLMRTVWQGMGTARVEAAPRGGIERTRNLASETQLLPLLVGMGGQGSGKQCLRIRMQGMRTQFETVGKFDEL